CCPSTLPPPLTSSPRSLHDALPIYAKVVSRRVNDARTRLAQLEESQLRKPPRELWFRGLTVGADRARRSWTGPVLTATQVSVPRSEEHTSELQSRFELVCRLLLEKK